MKRLEDWLLKRLQRRCEHPPVMVTVDLLEGCYTSPVAYCKRCGAVKIGTSPEDSWRRPDPDFYRHMIRDLRS